MTTLPRSLELRAEDNERTVRIRIGEWARDVARFLRTIPSTTYVTVDVPSAADVHVAADGRIKSVTVARVLSGIVTSAPGIEWDPAANGFTITALHGFSGDARLTLRVEV